MSLNFLIKSGGLCSTCVAGVVEAPSPLLPPPAAAVLPVCGAAVEDMVFGRFAIGDEGADGGR